CVRVRSNVRFGVFVLVHCVVTRYYAYVYVPKPSSSVYKNWFTPFLLLCVTFGNDVARIAPVKKIQAISPQTAAVLSLTSSSSEIADQKRTQLLCKAIYCSRYHNSHKRRKRQFCRERKLNLCARKVYGRETLVTSYNVCGSGISWDVGLEDCLQCVVFRLLVFITEVSATRLRSDCRIRSPAFQYKKGYSPLRSQANESFDDATAEFYLLILWVLSRSRGRRWITVMVLVVLAWCGCVSVLLVEKSIQLNIRPSPDRFIMKVEALISKVEVRRAKFYGMIDRLTQNCKDASHPDDILELLEEVLAFREQTLEVELQLKEDLKGEERDQEATQRLAEKHERGSDKWKAPHPTIQPDSTTLAPQQQAKGE
ncbi:hypothetical protein T4E_10225, partial [Trichinella pseudospiralis]